MNEMREFYENVLEYQLRFRGIKNENILLALKSLSRDNFRLSSPLSFNYILDTLSINLENSFIHWSTFVNLIEKLEIKTYHRILLVGPCLGYSAVLFSYLAESVYVVCDSIEEECPKVLKNFPNLYFFEGDSSMGLPHYAPFHCIIITKPSSCFPAKIIWQQLEENGKLVIPPKNFDRIKQFLLYTKSVHDIPSENIVDVDFIHLDQEQGFSAS